MVKSGRRPYRLNRRQIRLTHEKEREEEEHIDIEPPDVEAPTGRKAEAQSEPNPDPDPDPTTDMQSTQPSDPPQLGPKKVQVQVQVLRQSKLPGLAAQAALHLTLQSMTRRASSRTFILKTKGGVTNST